ncbi:MAG: PIN domain-containing protein [Solirubrobacteraceae bacterium]
MELFESVVMGAELWSRARELQLLLAAHGDHRRVPPMDLLICAAAEHADVPLVHYDRDYERLARVSALQHHWLVPDGTLAGEYTRGEPRRAHGVRSLDPRTDACRDSAHQRSRGREHHGSPRRQCQQ